MPAPEVEQAGQVGDERVLEKLAVLVDPRRPRTRGQARDSTWAPNLWNSGSAIAGIRELRVIRVDRLHVQVA
jgi:hypothetical protein